MQRGDGYFLPHGDGADGRRTPAVHRAQQAAGFTGQLGAGARAEAEVANVLIEAVRPDFEGQLDGGDVAGLFERLMDWNDSVVLALVVVNHASRQGDFASLAVDHVVGRGYMLVEGGGVGDQLEGRTRLVDIANRVIAQQRRRGVAKLVGIEGGTDGQRQNLAGVHVLDDYGAVIRMG